MSTKTTTARYYVHTVTSGVGNKIRTPYLVVDATTGQTVDEYASKRAAAMDARDRNEAQA